jgi:ABC-2 type transport system permease protein
MGTIYILWLRQLKRYVRSRSRIIGSLGQPLLFLVALGFGLGPIYEKAGGGNYLQFLTPGVISMGVLFTAMFSGMEIIWDRQFGFLKETLVAPVPRWHIMLGRTVGGATVATAQGLIIFAMALIAGFRPESVVMLPFALGIIFLVALLFTALGTAVASVLQDFQGFQLIMNLLVMPLFFLSGAFFPLGDLPFVMAAITRINPLSYGVDALRGTLVMNSSHFGLGLDLSVLSIAMVLCLLLGTYLFSRIEA